MSAAVSRRIGRVAFLEPLTSLSARERLDLARLAEGVKDFTELPESYQALVLAAEATRERLIIKHHTSEGSVA
jgi:hypothetical protein